VLRKVRKRALLPEEVRQSRFAVSATRLTVLKSLCQEASVANRFVTALARKTLERVEHGQGRSAHRGTPDDLAHRQMMAEALAEMDVWNGEATEARKQRLWDLLRQMREQQDEYQNIKWGAVRLIDDWELLLFEYAVRCLLNPPHEAGYWAYQTARHYAERYDSRYGTGLIPATAPLMQDIADFWLQEFGLDRETLTVPARRKKATEERAAAPRGRKRAGGKEPKARFAPRQGQFLAFLHLYRKLHRQGPAELDLVQFFRVTPPSAHPILGAPARAPTASATSVLRLSVGRCDFRTEHKDSNLRRWFGPTRATEGFGLSARSSYPNECRCNSIG
jgi:hypothetical protein